MELAAAPAEEYTWARLATLGANTRKHVPAVCLETIASAKTPPACSTALSAEVSSVCPM